MSNQYHVTESICDEIVWVRGKVIEDFFNGFIHVFRGCRLLGFNVAEADEEFGVDEYVMVQKGSQDALNMLD